jgi:hypothetical protein
MNRKRVRDIAILVALAPLILTVFAVVLAFLAVYGVFNSFRGFWLRTRFRRKWGPEGKRILFVYSESPNWQAYIEQKILPGLSPFVISLNYSRRAEWKNKKPLEAKIWEQWAGDTDFNPIAIVLPDRGRVKVVRFYQAFRDFKHGNDRLLRQKEDELYGLASQISTDR